MVVKGDREKYPRSSSKNASAKEAGFGGDAHRRSREKIKGETVNRVRGEGISGREDSTFIELSSSAPRKKKKV